MATGTHAGSNWNTTGTGLTVVNTPAVGDLIMVIHGMSGYAGGDTSTISDNQSGTYRLWGNAIGSSSAPRTEGGGTAGALWYSIRTQFITSAVSTTWTCTNVGHTGGGLTVLRFSGMSRLPSVCIRQQIDEPYNTESPPSITFDTATLTSNPIILATLGEDNPIGTTVPTGFTSVGTINWATPATGIQICWVDSGQTASTYAWTGGALTDHCDFGVELDASALSVRDLIGGGIGHIPRAR